MEKTVIPIVIGALCTILKRLVKELEDLEIRGQLETIQTSLLLRPARILRRVLKTWRDLLSLKPKWKTTASTVGKNFQKGNTNNNNDNS